MLSMEGRVKRAAGCLLPLPLAGEGYFPLPAASFVAIDGLTRVVALSASRELSVKAWQEMSHGGRDLRLDFFRGLALIFIFVDHIPTNVLGLLTVRNFGFSDAAEIFVFISGYSAALAYASRLQHHGWPHTAARVLGRCWTLYVAHIFLFVVFTAQIAWVASTFDNPMFAEEMNIIHFLNDTHVTLIQALLLKFRPVNMDILPLYVVLLASFPLLLPLAVRLPVVTVAGSFLLYIAAQAMGWNLRAFPDGEWFFNPFTWQFLFVIGAVLGAKPDRAARIIPDSRVLFWLASAVLAAALFVVAGWTFAALRVFIPSGLEQWMYPIDKTNLDVLRLLHFLALAYVVTILVRPEAKFLSGRAAAPLVVCGRHGLALFCVGTFLSFGSHFLVVQAENALWVQLAVSASGIGALIMLAYVLSWYQNAERKGAGRRFSANGAGS